MSALPPLTRIDALALEGLQRELEKRSPGQHRNIFLSVVLTIRSVPEEEQARIVRGLITMLANLRDGTARATTNLAFAAAEEGETLVSRSNERDPYVSSHIPNTSEKD